MFQVEPTWKPGLLRDRDLGAASDEILRGRLAASSACLRVWSEMLSSQDSLPWRVEERGCGVGGGAEEAALEDRG